MPSSKPFRIADVVAGGTGVARSFRADEVVTAAVLADSGGPRPLPHRRNPALQRFPERFEVFRPVRDLERAVAVPGREDGFVRAVSPHPISPGPVPTDAFLYQHPTDASTTYWIPRYRLRESGGRYEIAVAEDAGAWTVSFGLQTHPAPEVAEAARTAQPLPHAVRFALSYGAGIVRRLEAVEAVPDGGGLTVAFRMTLEERDGLLRAFQSDAARATLSVSRGIEVAVPVAAPSRFPSWILTLRDQQLTVQPPEPEVLVPFEPPDPLFDPSRARLGVEAAAVAAVRPRLLHRAAVSGRLPEGIALQLGRRKFFDERLAVEAARSLRFPVLFPEPLPEPQPPPEPLYRRCAVSLDLDAPLRFDPAVHPYLFDTGLGGAQRAEFQRVVVRHPPADPRATAFTYFQDTARPNVFSYLPDEFLLARTEEEPHVPALALRLKSSPDGSQGMELTCLVRPRVDGERLLAAREELARSIPVRTGVDRVPVLQPIVAPARLRLGMPQGPLESTAQVDVANGFWITETVSLAEFQELFAVLAAGADVSTLLRGSVTVQTGLAADDQVPVELRLRRLTGELFEQTETWDETAGTMAITLRNATESALRLGALRAWLRRGEELVTASVEDLPDAAEIESEATVALTLRPAGPLPGEGPVDAVLDLSGTAQLVDPEVVLDLALDETVAMLSTRRILVMTTTGVLEGGGDPAERIDTIVVEFAGGARAVLDAQTTKVDVDVAVPLVDVLLRRDSGGAYRYRQTVVLAEQPPVEDDWRSGDRSVLVVPVRT